MIASPTGAGLPPRTQEPASRRLRYAVEAAFTWCIVLGLFPFLWWLTWLSRRRPVRRSLWAGTPMLTLPIKAKAESLLGVRAESLVYETYYITSAFHYDLSRWMNRGFVWRRLLPFAVLAWACVRYQRFHFFCDRGLLPARRFRFPLAELVLYRLLGKEVFFYAYGADVRTHERTLALGEPNCCTECPSPGTACVCHEDVARKNFARLSRYATGIFSLGDMVHYTPGSRNDLFYWPIDLDADGGRRYRPVYPDGDAERPLRVVHAPNHRGFKGTHYLIEAVERLRSEGISLELVLVERVPNEQALEIYRSADVVFDQCLIGFHGYFALEAMAMGKPVMVFIRSPHPDLADAAECPFINTRADQVETNLRWLAANRDVLRNLGVRGRRYIEKHHSVPALAARMARAFGNNCEVTGSRPDRKEMAEAA